MCVYRYRGAQEGDYHYPKPPPPPPNTPELLELAGFRGRVDRAVGRTVQSLNPKPSTRPVILSKVCREPLGFRVEV